MHRQINVMLYDRNGLDLMLYDRYGRRFQSELNGDGTATGIRGKVMCPTAKEARGPLQNGMGATYQLCHYVGWRKCY